MVEQRRKKQAHNSHDTCLVDNVVVFDDLPENLMFDILVRLPLETLCSSRFVCKSWFEIISSHDFRNAHLRRSEKTTTRGLIFLTNRGENYINFLKIKDGKSTIKDYKTALNGRICAACNGLIVLERNPKTDGLILHNPVTREDEDIPVGTISSTEYDMYGLAFCHVSRRYKLLHLFFKDMLSNLLGCEIMDIGSGSWRAVDVPPTKGYYFFLHNPVFALGALHWIQYEDRNQFMVSMPLDDEKFKTMAMPEKTHSYFKSVFAMGEFLGFASRLQRSNDHHQIGVWILRGLGGECGGWEKQYNIDVASGLRCFTTLLCYGGDNGRHAFIFKCGEDGFLYAYDDRHSQHMRKIKEVVGPTTYWNFVFPHVNNLVSWRST